MELVAAFSFGRNRTVLIECSIHQILMELVVQTDGTGCPFFRWEKAYIDYLEKERKKKEASTMQGDGGTILSSPGREPFILIYSFFKFTSAIHKCLELIS